MKIALVGNPNSGKTTLFNQLTGMNQKTGNYPGVTVDKKKGFYTDNQNSKHELLDLPGIYSIYPKTKDEEIAWEIITHKQHPDYPDLAIVVVDSTNLERNLLLFTQILDLGLPVILALNRADLVKKGNVSTYDEKLSELFGGIECVSISAKSNEGIAKLKEKIANFDFAKPQSSFLDNEFTPKKEIPSPTQQKEWVHQRYQKIRKLIGFIDKETLKSNQKNIKLDKILTHPIYGYLIFLGILLLIFQAIYAWAEVPMNIIDEAFVWLGGNLKNILPEGMLTDLIVKGILPGILGVVIFIPQIALLFFFIFLMEESGYMARVVFIMDRLMRPFGLNGRSVVPLISGWACAIPAIMATRSIESWKERLITIMVTPFMSCSARLPVFTLLIALTIPDRQVFLFNLKGLTLLGLYLLGIFAALLSAFFFHIILKTKRKGFLIMEMPYYQFPKWKNLLYSVYEKIRIFVFQAGKIILAISIILFVLASFGPGDSMENAVQSFQQSHQNEKKEILESEIASIKLEHSYIGHLGKTLEPIFEPLGYNWQIGIAIITSFAAREVFVGSMATIYSVENTSEVSKPLIQRMRDATNHRTGKKLYTLPSGLSLMVFYAFALQCMSTVAITRRETKSWKWAIIQFVFMGAWAYLSSWIVYNQLS